MYTYQISKYNPKYYDTEDGRYLKDDWTAIGDIGYPYDGVVLTDKEYMRTEDAYVKAIDMIFDYHSLDGLFVSRYMRSSSYRRFRKFTKPYYHLYSKELLEFYRSYEGGPTSKEDVGKLCRLQLREDVWSEMRYPRRLKFSIAYDYLLGVSSSRLLDKIIPKIEDLGLYVYEIQKTKVTDPSQEECGCTLVEWVHNDRRIKKLYLD